MPKFHHCLFLSVVKWPPSRMPSTQQRTSLRQPLQWHSLPVRIMPILMRNHSQDVFALAAVRHQDAATIFAGTYAVAVFAANNIHQTILSVYNKVRYMIIYSHPKTEKHLRMYWGCCDMNSHMRFIPSSISDCTSLLGEGLNPQRETLAA